MPSEIRWRDMCAVAAPAVLAAALGVYGLTSRSLGFDESASVTIAAQHGHALRAAIEHDGGNMSGYYVLLHLITGLFGRSVWVVRLPSVIFTAITVALVGVLGLRLFDRRVALFAGLLTAVSLPLVFWSQSARGYAPMVALVTASCLAFAAVLEKRRLARTAYVICTVLAVYASFVAVLVVAAQLTVLVWRRRDAARSLLVALGACVVCWVPLVVLAAVRGSGQLFWVPRPNLTAEKQVLLAVTSAGLEPSFRPVATAAALAILTVAAIVVAALSRRGLPERESIGRALVLSWLVVPVVLAWVESAVGQSIFLPRNLLFVLPAVALLLALGLADRRLPRPASWALLVALIALRAVPLADSYGVSPENSKAATAYVLARAQPGDCIAFYPSDARMGFAYYLGAGAGRAPRPVLPAAPWGALRPYVEDYATLSPVQLSALPRQCPRLWLVSTHEGDPIGPTGSRANYARFIALRSALDREYPARQDASFGYAAAIRVRLLRR